MKSSPCQFYMRILAYKREVGGARTFDLMSHNKPTFRGFFGDSYAKKITELSRLKSV